MKKEHGTISIIKATNMQGCTTHLLRLPDQDSRMKNGHAIISMIRATNMPEYTAHPLWLPEQDEEWTWDHQHDENHQYARVHNSPPMISRAGSRMDMELSAWWELPTCQKARLTNYNCQRRVKNGHGIISISRITNMPDYTTHLL